MKVLLTGDKGFVGSHIRVGLENSHDVVGLDVAGSFTEWINDMNSVLGRDIEAVVHCGAISNNQCDDPDIYLWNAYGTYLLAKTVRTINANIPFIFFSSFVVSATESEPESRTPYGWTKAVAEDLVQEILPDATIIRPGVMWGKEVNKKAHVGSVPWRLASHNIEFLIRGWKRRYVHVDDVVEAIKNCLNNRPRGIFEISSDKFYTNEELAGFVQWEDYQWIDKASEGGFKFVSHHDKIGGLNLLPGWSPQVRLETELPRLEKELHGDR